MSVTDPTWHRPDPTEAGEILQAEPAHHRGFLGLDPVVQNAAWMARRLISNQAAVYTSDGQLLGVAPDPSHSEFAQISMTHGAGSQLPAFLELVEQHHGFSRFITYVDSDESPADYVDNGFHFCGTLRAHRLRGGERHNVQVYIRTGTTA